MSKQISFNVVGTPRPKQSFKFSQKGGYTPSIVRHWQQHVSIEARLAMNGRQPLEGDLTVLIDFYLPDRRRRDIDNLSKACLDACNGIVWVDDQQITELHLTKSFNSKEHGVTVTVEPKR